MNISSLPVSEARMVYDALQDSAHIAATHRQRELAMATINNLLNQLVPVRSSGQVLSPSNQSAVIEAVVLSNSPLMKSPDGTTQTQVTLSHNQQRLELTAQTAIPVGARVQLKITANNLAVILSINDKPVTANTPQPSTSTPLTGGLLTTAAANTLVTKGETATTSHISNHLLNNTQQTAFNIPNRQASDFNALRPLIEQTVRQSLPQQQSLRTLLPIISQVLTQPRPLPKELVVALTHLKNQFPQASQLQQPIPLKRAMRDSGTFFESKLAQQILNHQQAKNNGAPKASNQADTPINRDIKGLIERALPLIQKAIYSNTETAKPNTTSNSNSELLNVLRQEFATPIMGQHPGSTTTGKHAEGGKPIDAGLDIVLRQLGRQLLATLAKTQISQLESLVARNPATPDAPAPANSWTLELPIINGKHIDNLELRIDQQEAERQDGGEKRKKQWMVTLNFDLHQLGKMQVQLAIIEQQVSAAVWSHQRQTHEQVRQSIEEFKQSLEQVGVTVKHVECHWGEAPKSPALLYQQLVDVRT